MGNVLINCLFIRLLSGEKAIIDETIIDASAMPEMLFKLDRETYKPKQTLSGALILKYEKPVDVKSLDIYLKGYEEAIVGSGLTLRKTRNEFLSECLQVYRNESLEKGEYEIRFEFDLPGEMLASYMGFNNSIVYSVEAHADVIYPNPKEAVQNFGVLPVEKGTFHRNEPLQFSFRKPKPYPEFFGMLNQQQFYAGDAVVGEFTIFNRYKQNVREVTLILMSEDCVTYEDETTTIPQIEAYPRYKDIQKIAGSKLNFGYPHQFRFIIPKNAYSTFSGKHSSHKWYFYMDVDVALLTEVFVKKEIGVFNQSQRFSMQVLDESDR